MKRQEEEELHKMAHDEWKEKRDARYNELIEEKRQSRYSQKLSERTDVEPEPADPRAGLLSETQVSFDSVMDQKEEDEVLQILARELPEPILDSQVSNEEMFMADLNSTIETRYTEAIANMVQVKERCEAELINWWEVNGDLDIEKTAIQAYILTDPIKFRNESLFERAYELAPEVAAKLLDQGYCFLGRFGKVSPVQYYEQRDPVYKATEFYDAIPIMYRDYIYYTYSRKERDKFLENPLKYLSEDFKFPMISLVVGVIGPPKSGKTTLATRLGLDTNFAIVSRGQACRDAFHLIPFANVTLEMGELLRKGLELTDEIVMECVQASTLGGEELTRGIILDGFPMNHSEVRILRKLGLVPHVIFDLQATKVETLKHLATVTGKEPLYSPRFITLLRKHWLKGQAKFRDWCDREYQNIFKIGVDQSIWGVSDTCREVLWAATSERKHYFTHANLDWPLRLSYMLVTPLEFLERQSSYKSYCPVCLQRTRSLKNGGDPPDRTGLVQFRECFYWICEDHIEDFLKQPEAFIPPNNINLPQELPKNLQLSEDPTDPAEDGYCLLCYFNSLPEKNLIRGNRLYAARYIGRTYLFDCEVCLQTFMSNPKIVSGITINFKKDIEYPSVDYEHLPVLGMLEQYVARSLVKAVHHANNFTRVPVPDERFDYLCEYFKPLSKVPAFLNVVDIAGLVKGASEGQGLGNAFLSHISACDAIFHLCRAFEDEDVTHVEGEINPVRDLDIIAEELRLKDEDTLLKNLDKLEKTVGRAADKKLKAEYDTLVKVKGVLVDEKKHIRFGDWDTKDIEVLNKYLFLTSKPTIYLVNLSEKDYIKKKNKWLVKIKEWVDKNDPGSLIIPFSGAFEQKLSDEYDDPELRKKFLEENNITSALDKIIVQGYKALQLEYFFTSGPDEVKAWTIQKGTKAPQAAGRIHTDFEKGFIMAEVMKYVDFKEEGSETACKAAGKYRQQGRNYTVEDGDIIFFKFNAGAGLKDPKKK